VTIDYSLTLRRLSKSRRLAWHQNAGLWITERSRYPPDALKAQRALSARRKHVHVFGNPGILIILCHLPLWERFSHHKRSSNIGGDYEKSTIRRLFQIYSERHNTATLAALYTSRRGGSLLHWFEENSCQRIWIALFKLSVAVGFELVRQTRLSWLLYYVWFSLLIRWTMSHVCWVIDDIFDERRYGKVAHPGKHSYRHSCHTLIFTVYNKACLILEIFWTIVQEPVYHVSEVTKQLVFEINWT